MEPIPKETIILIIIFSIIAFMFGSIYGKKEMKRLVKYCVEQQSSVGIISCIDKEIEIEPGEYLDPY